MSSRMVEKIEKGTEQLFVVVKLFVKVCIHVNRNLLEKRLQFFSQSEIVGQ